MFLKCIDTGLLESNCYILGASGEAAVIDPGAGVHEIEHILDSNELVLKYIILTHAHIDHIMHADELRSSCGAKIAIHEEDAPLLGNPLLNGSVLFGLDRTFGNADLCVKDGGILELGCGREPDKEGERCAGRESGSGHEPGVRLEFIHTPGHTPGSMCILARMIKAAGGTGSEAYECLFTGDTLFRLGVGRTDLGAGDYSKLVCSLRRLMELDGDLKVYPGHGPETVISYEKRYNRFIR